MQVEVEKQKIGCDRIDLDTAEKELRLELERVYESLYKRALPSLHHKKISIRGFWRFISHLGVIEELKKDANKSVHLTHVRSAHRRK
jgi:hypothetical protein